jgi:hypothetical protein
MRNDIINPAAFGSDPRYFTGDAKIYTVYAQLPDFSQQWVNGTVVSMIPRYDTSLDPIN